MDAKKQAFLVLLLVSLGLTALAVLVLALMFSEYLLIAGEIAGGVAFLRFGALPITEKIIQLNGTIQRQRLERQELLYKVEPDKHGVFPQLFDARERRPVYYGSGYAPGQHALPAPRRVVESNVEPEEEDREPEPLAEILYLSDFLKRGLDPAGSESLLGFRRDNGQPVYATLFDKDGNTYNSAFIAGETGFGKSVFGVLNAVYTVANGGGLLLIDPDAELEQSLYNRLGALRQFLLCDVATTPEEARRVLKIARAELERPSGAPLLWLIDEFSAIARSLKFPSSAWASVAAEIMLLVEEYASQGRKRLRRAVVFGQYTQASRSGGTEVRDNMAQAIFRLHKRQARLVLEREDAEQVTQFRQGEMLLVPARSSQRSIAMQLLYPDDQAIEQITRARQAQPWRPGAPRNIRALAPLPAPAGSDNAARVLNLLEAGYNQKEIIEQVWGVTKGGSERYRSALEEYRAIVASQADQSEIIYGG